MEFELSFDSQYQLYEYFDYPVITATVFKKLYKVYNLHPSLGVILHLGDSGYYVGTLHMGEYDPQDVDRFIQRDSLYVKYMFTGRKGDTSMDIYFYVKDPMSISIPFIDTSIWGIFKSRIERWNENNK